MTNPGRCATLNRDIMKFEALILFFSLSSCVYGQETYPNTKDFKSLVLGKYNYIYSSTNCGIFEDKVKSLIEENNPDSSFKATKIMWGLSLYDTIKYSDEYFNPQLDRIIKSNTAYFESNLKGEWRFSHDFWTGMVLKTTTTTDIDTGKVIRFDGHTAYFYFNDSLFRQTSYKVVVQKAGIEFTRVNYYNILLEDKNENWSFSLAKNLHGSEMIMTVHLEPNCSCGCRQDIYRRIKYTGVDILTSERTKKGL
ncbi:hypothetical protein [Paraflavitalea sp. CAU 1676]|uniref:hypothetical protein n=1 Tax=Paraflavitalea sp. CAU 1676 TaxID=3032598 RepID=UPI0023DB30E2|nr:hypothetical protein [Paraflavitalea sp. CAU 1676]MDF2189132.1 hypothetical protein [Paraflavitalea sp. CAU 1676]